MREQRLIQYDKDIISGRFKKEQIENLFKDMKEECIANGRNHLIYDLAYDLHYIKPYIAEYFNCEEDEICLYDYIARNTLDTVCPYKIILGNANFNLSRIKNLGKLNKIYGDAIFIDSSRDLIDLGQLTSIEGNATFRKSFIKSLGKLERVGGNLSLRDSKVTNLADLTYIGKNAFFEHSLITNFNMLKYVGGDIYIEPQHIKDCLNVDVKGDVVLGIETYSINKLKDKASRILEKNKEMQKI